MTYNYDGRIFRSVSNTDNGEVSEETRFVYHQEGQIVYATYQGGGIEYGQLIAHLIPDTGQLDMRYQHINSNGDLMTGRCTSTPEILSDGRYRMHERWQWTSGDRSQGESIVEEVRDE
jgi:hypothetical protein